MAMMSCSDLYFCSVDWAVADGRHQRRMTFQHAELALSAGHDDHVDRFGADQLFGGGEFKMQCHFSFL